MDITKLKELVNELQVEGENTISRKVDEEIYKFLKNDKVEKLYLILDKKNAFIILKTIAIQYAYDKISFNLKLDILGEVLYDRYLQDEKIVQVFLACAIENDLRTFVKLCDITKKHGIKL